MQSRRNLGPIVLPIFDVVEGSALCSQLLPIFLHSSKASIWIEVLGSGLTEEAQR